MSKYIIISALILSILLSGCLEKTTTINGDNYSKSVIQHVLDMSDKNITKYIDSVTVYDNEEQLNEKCKSIKSTRELNETYVDDYAGCADVIYNSDSDNSDIKSSNMYILSDNKLKDYCNSEASTISYLIGTIEYRKKYSSIIDGYYVNSFATEYANNHFKDKCSSDEYLNIISNYNILKSKYDTITNNQNTAIDKYNAAIDKYNAAINSYSIKWDYYLKDAATEITKIEKIEPQEIKPQVKTISNNCQIINGFNRCTATPLAHVTYTPRTIAVYNPRICNTYSGQYCGIIPEDRYNEYTRDYEILSNAYQEYSTVYDEYSSSYDGYSNAYDEYFNSYEENSNKLNESLRNYRYPFEVKT